MKAANRETANRTGLTTEEKQKLETRSREDYLIAMRR